MTSLPSGNKERPQTHDRSGDFCFLGGGLDSRDLGPGRCEESGKTAPCKNLFGRSWREPVRAGLRGFSGLFVRLSGLGGNAG